MFLKKIIHDSQSDRCKMVCLWSLFAVCDDLLHWASFHIPIGNLYVLFGKVSIQVLWPFFNWVVCFFGVEFCKYFINFGY